MATIETKQRADGTTAYRVRYRLKPGGNPTVDTFNTPGEAADYAHLVDRIGGEAARMKRLASASSTGVPLAEVMDDYLKSAPDITPGSGSEYRRILARSGIVDTLGKIPVDLIDKRDIEAWVHRRSTTISEITERAVSPKTLRNEHGLLSTLLEHAASRGWRAGNPAKGVRLPRSEKVEKVIPTDGEYRSILGHVSKGYQPLVMLLAVTGARWGEATALTWGDITPATDATPATVRISKAWKHDGGSKRVLGGPKTQRGHRTISVPGQLLDKLGERGKKHELVFKNRLGNRINYQTFYRDHWKTACEAAEIEPRPTIHSLRHYCASTLLARGVPISAVSRRLGHESIQVTVDVYGHLTPDMAHVGVAESAAILANGPAELTA